ncbi:hypothetical protein FRACA_10088 [Frankia canadensis]|uniref:Uncharacterized protein n=1 Tax=Frankia canadensis TaxID=1836972 RepID=A0A2I2KI73_9ACTN|nr:hypothetical protein FRACA_10088 [Frankia canadensis]SOU52619.1 hypothetical protein FRACA_10088 [Frankia canadensis]
MATDRRLAAVIWFQELARGAVLAWSLSDQPTAWGRWASTSPAVSYRNG